MADQKLEPNLMPELPNETQENPLMPAQLPSQEQAPQQEKHEQAPQQLESKNNKDIQYNVDDAAPQASQSYAAEIPFDQPKDPLAEQIEKIMEEDLGEAFDALTTVQKQEFKIKGEQTAHEIRELMKKTRVKMQKVFKLLIAWLAILPGINKFFLEQEAKIKADKILALKRENQL